jgi:predicted RNA-binding protein with PIN domain
MSILIDGHNLIPKIPGLRLDDPQDEPKLILVLQEYCRQGGKTLEVYFDQAPPGQAGTRKFGMVTAHFIRQGRTADQAIQERLVRLGRQAANFTVVSSDRQIQAAAHSARAKVLSAEEFSAEIFAASKRATPLEAEKPPGELSESEVEAWLEIFQPKPKSPQGHGRKPPKGADPNGQD